MSASPMPTPAHAIAATAPRADESRASRWLLTVHAPWLDATLQALDGLALRPRRLTCAADAEWVAVSIVASGRALDRALALAGAGEEAVRAARWDAGVA